MMNLKFYVLRILTAVICFSFCSVGSPKTSLEFIQKHAQKFRELEISPGLIQSVENAKLILIGESHGTNEMPEYAFSLVKKVATNHLVAFGFEFPIDAQAQVDSFLKTGDEASIAAVAFFMDANEHSGRGSRAMIQVLKNLRARLEIKVFCFDLPKGDSAIDRDTKLAMNILDFMRKNPDRTIITLSGNIHSRLTVGFPSDLKHKNMGSEILRLSEGKLNFQNTRSILFRFDQGSAWQCSLNLENKVICGNQILSPAHTDYATAVSLDRYFLHELELTDGHSESIFIRKVSASSPWKTVAY